MNALGIQTGLDLRQRTKDFLLGQFGKAGEHNYWISRAMDRRPVVPDRERKSIGVERTFARDLTTWGELADALAPISGKVWEHCARTGARGRTVTLKARYSDFRQVTRGRTLAVPVDGAEALLRVGLELAASLLPLPRGVRLLGLSLSNLHGEQNVEGRQLTLTL